MVLNCDKRKPGDITAATYRNVGFNLSVVVQKRALPTFILDIGLYGSALVRRLLSALSSCMYAC